MTLSSLGDLAQNFTLRRQTTELKAALDRRMAEATTGTTTDIGRALRGDFTPLSAIDTVLSRLDGFKAATTEAQLFAEGQQQALGTVAELSTGLARTLVAAASPGGATPVNAVAADAGARFATAVAVLNARVGDRTLLAGNETRGAALASPDTILDTLVTATAGAVTAGDVETAVTAWFADPAGYATLGYLGGPPLDPLAVAADESVRLGATAADPAIRDTLKGLAMAALLGRGVLVADPAERANLALRAGESLFASAADRIELAARIGTAEERIAGATDRNAAEATGLQIARSGLVSVDPYEAASALTEAETQLQTLYSITARLSRLSLADYL